MSTTLAMTAIDPTHLTMGLVASVFMASVLGSTHCVGMCGAFLALAVQPAADGVSKLRGSSHAAMQGAYHGGRLVSYVTLGASAGAIGSVIDMGSSMAGVQRAALVLAGLTIAGFGVATLLQLRGVRVPRLPMPAAMRRVSVKLHERAMGLPPAARAGTIGLLSTLLPCGWLYAFVVVAGGSASLWVGAMIMAIFWAGTLPLLVAAGAGVRALGGRLAARLPMLTALAMVLVGGLAIAGRMPMLGVVVPHTASVVPTGGVVVPEGDASPCCHGE